LAALEAEGVAAREQHRGGFGWIVRLLRAHVHKLRSSSASVLPIGDEAFGIETVISAAGLKLTVDTVVVRVGPIVATVAVGSRSTSFRALADRLGGTVATRIAGRLERDTGSTGASGATGATGAADVLSRATLGTADLRDVACPSTTQCTVVNQSGDEITFNPLEPSERDTFDVDPDDPLFAVACPVATQCTTVGYQGREITFDPTAPSKNTRRRIFGNSLYSLACPTATECVAGGYEGLFAFDPETAQGVLRASIPRAKGYYAMSCPSAGECVAVAQTGQQAVIKLSDTTMTASPGPSAKAAWSGVDCPSVTQCTAVGGLGMAMTYDPQTPSQSIRRRKIDAADNDLSTVVCPASNTCIAVHGDDAGEGMEFDPTTLSIQADQVLDLTEVPVAIACPSTQQCTAVGNGGAAVTFRPFVAQN
jgi:hypothetical protein